LPPLSDTETLASRLLRTLGWTAFYGALVVWLTWPLAARIATELPTYGLVCRFDTFEGVWVLAWGAHALATEPLRLPHANMFHPAPWAFFYGATALGAQPYFAPTFLATGNPVLAANVMQLLCTALTAVGVHAIVARWSGSVLAGAVAGWATLLNPYFTQFVPSGQFTAVLLYLPWIAWLAARRDPPPRAAIALWLLVVGQMLVDPVYYAAAVVAVLGPLAIFRLARRRTAGAGSALAGVLVASLVAMAPVYAGYLVVRHENADVSHQTLNPPEATAESPRHAFPVGAVRLTRRGIEGTRAAAASTPMLLLVVAGAVLALLGRRTDAEARGWTHGALWTVTGLVASTRALDVGGSVVVLPHYVVLGRLLPAVNALVRDSQRLGVVALIGFAILTGMAFARCADTVARGRTPVSAALALGFAATLYVLRPLPLGPRVLTTQPAMALRSHVLDGLDERGPVLELPVGEEATDLPWPASMTPIFASARYQARAMFRSIFHWRPLLNGYSSYWPSDFPERMALARRLPDPESLHTLRATTGLETIVVHTEDVKPAARAVWLALAARGGSDDLRLVGRDGAELVFDVR
jgi:hypothetical protein